MHEWQKHDPDQILEGLALLLDDKRYIMACLRRIPHQHHDWTLDQYRKAWLRGQANTQIGHQKDNAGRYAANVWLHTLLAHKCLPVPATREYTPQRSY